MGEMDGLVLVWNEYIKLGFSDGENMGIKFSSVTIFKLGCKEGSYLGYLGSSFEGFNDGNMKGSLIGDAYELKIPEGKNMKQ